MTAPPFRIELFQKDKHDRTEFDCGVQELNDYFRKQLSQDIKRNVTLCYVVLDNKADAIAGYYTISMGQILLNELPEKTVKKLPRYPSVPVARVGCLAIDKRYQGQGLGGGILSDAIRRAITSGVACFAVVVDAKDEGAVSFYEHFGFIRLKSQPKSLFLTVSLELQQLYSMMFTDD
ncbi:MAG: GNAT family N-acetyltransferase [Blastopirellula sp.]|nr:MAG: GNAT family N-acetyltransferase [Blastopirellula sp.]